MSFTVKQYNYKKVGKTIFVYINLSGVSNSITTSFTLPYTVASPVNLYIPAIVSDNSGINQLGMIALSSGASLVACYVNLNSTTWTASNNKGLSVNFSYQST